MAEGQGTRPKRYVCRVEGCRKGFTRSDHLSRHALNHGDGASTCPRCNAHFKRRDLLSNKPLNSEGAQVTDAPRDRHLDRHKQRDAEAGGDGLGTIMTRKRLWRDPDGHIVDTQHETTIHQTSSTPEQSDQSEYPTSSHDAESTPTTPTIVTGSTEGIGTLVQDAFPAVIDPQSQLDHAQSPDLFTFLANSSWGLYHENDSTPTSLSHNDIFQLNTASSFNNPSSTTMYYDWLFNVAENSQVLPSVHISEARAPQMGLYQATARELLRTPDSLLDHVRDSQPMGSIFNMFRDPENIQSGNIIQDHNLRGQTSGTSNSEIGQSEKPKSRCPTTPQNLSSHSSSEQFISPSSLRLPNNNSQRPFPDGGPLLQDRPSASKGSSFVQKVQALRPTVQPDHLPTFNEASRQKILELSGKAKLTESHGSLISLETSLLTLSAIQTYCDLFFTQFNVAYPIIHMATFEVDKTETLLLLSIILLGATYSGKDAHKLAVCIHDSMRAQIFQHPDFTEDPELWLLQTLLLVECFGKSRAGQKQHSMSHIFHGMLINLIRRSGCPVAQQPILHHPEDDLDNSWHLAMQIEQRKRLAFFCFMWDARDAVLFSQAMCMSAFELRTTLPCSAPCWEAASAHEWWINAEQDTPMPFLSALKLTINPGSDKVKLPLNAQSRILLLHGLMSVQWEMKQRDHNLLGLDANLAGDKQLWQERLEGSYDTWKTDFDCYCMDMRLSFGGNLAMQQELTRFDAASTAIYHAANIALNVDILDLQIYAGASHIIGRPVTLKDRERSTSALQALAISQRVPPLVRAAWHGAHMLRDGIMKLHNWDVNHHLYYPWCLYLATLACWVSNDVGQDILLTTNGIHPDTSQPRFSKDGGDDQFWIARADMNAGLSMMTRDAPETLCRSVGKFSTAGLVFVIAKHLETIRWAVIHEATKVLHRVLTKVR